MQYGQTVFDIKHSKLRGHILLARALSRSLSLTHTHLLIVKTPLCVCVSISLSVSLKNTVVGPMRREDLEHPASRTQCRKCIHMGSIYASKKARERAREREAGERVSQRAPSSRPTRENASTCVCARRGPGFKWGREREKPSGRKPE